MNERRKGFTLIELLVVIAIIALLSSVVLTSLSTARMKSRDARRISDIRQIAIAISMYADANGAFPQVQGTAYNVGGVYDLSYTASWNDLATKLKPYINPLPKDPINSNCAPYLNGTDCYSYAYGNVGNGVAESTNSGGLTTYDLFARFETKDHPQSCGVQKYKARFFQVNLCPGNPNEMYRFSMD